MHSCLSLHEVVDLICYHTISHRRPLEHRQTLTVLARTCRSFHEPALNHIWYEICNLVPLVQCMPGDLWQVQGEKLVFTRPIIESDWTRFKEYARRVRVFGTEIFYHKRMWIEGYRTLSTAAGREVLLPNIRELRLKKHYKTPLAEDSLYFIHLLLGKKLHAIDIWLTRSTHSISYLSFLAGMNSWYPSLTNVTVLGIESIEGLQILSSAVCGLHQLRDLQVSALSTEALIHVASLPSLRRLRLLERIDGAPKEFPSIQNAPAFPSLRALYIQRSSFTFCAGLLQSMSIDSALTSVWFQTSIISTPTEWGNLCSSLCDRCSYSSLKSITIESQRCTIVSPIKDNIITIDHLLPFLAFTHLTSIDLFSPGGIDISDITIKDMAMAWPRLGLLRLGGLIPNLLPKVTLLGLIPLAQYCPRLYFLSLPFDATHTPENTGPRVFNDRLDTLEVFSSPIKDPPWIAAFLSDIFPDLTQILSADHAELDPQWKEVEKLIEVFASVRSQEATRRAFARPSQMG